jgi:hypothetical protein
MTTLFTTIIMAALVTKVNSVCMAAMVTDITCDFLLMMITFITKVTSVYWLPRLRESTRSVLVAYVSYLVCAIFTCLHTLIFRENG